MKNLLDKWRKEVETLKRLSNNVNLVYEIRCKYNTQITRLLLCIDDLEKEILTSNGAVN